MKTTPVRKMIRRSSLTRPAPTVALVLCAASLSAHAQHPTSTAKAALSRACWSSVEACTTTCQATFKWARSCRRIAGILREVVEGLPERRATALIPTCGTTTAMTAASVSHRGYFLIRSRLQANLSTRSRCRTACRKRAHTTSSLPASAQNRNSDCTFRATASI